MAKFTSDLNIEECIFELIANSLTFNSNAIGIRLNVSKQKIQVIDNGIGISKGILQTVGEIEYNSYNSIFNKIIRNCDSLLITTRTTNSPVTYVKIFKGNNESKIIEGVQRPSTGTTISIRGLKLLFAEKNKYLIIHAVAIFALFNLQVSFSVRDDEEKKLMLRVCKPHNSKPIIKYICNHNEIEKTHWYLEIVVNSSTSIKAHIGLMKDLSNYQRQIFVNSKFAICTKIKNLLCTVLHKIYKYWFQNFPNKYVFYYLYIECPVSEFDVHVINTKLNISFKNRDIVRSLKWSLKKNVISSLLKTQKHMLTYRQRNPKLNSESKNPIQLLSKNMSIFSINKQKHSLFIKEKSQQTLTRKIIKNYHDLTIKNKYVDIIKKQLNSPVLIKKSNEIKQTTDEKDDNEAFNSIAKWSDWNHKMARNVQKVTINNLTYFYPQKEVDNLNNNQYYSFLPINLQNLLKYKNKIMVKQPIQFSQEDCNKESTMIDLTYKQYGERGIRNIERMGHIDEFKLNRESLCNIKVMRQVNHEFIAAITVQENKKLLLLIDQHAIHERIRYEQLLEVYRIKDKRNEYVSKLLRTPITITDLGPEICHILIKNQKILQKYGIALKINNNDIIIYSVPLCFQSRRNWNDDFRLITFVKKLLFEVTDSLMKTNTVMILPTSIHLAIATEACRGAIKFGDPLTVYQCESLLNILKHTSGFSRCAHGRPSIIPLVDVSNLITDVKYQTKKLNYASLIKNRFI